MTNRMNLSRTTTTWCNASVIGCLLVLVASHAAAVEICRGPGVECRSDAAHDAIVLGVQAGISALPPTSGQSFSYEFDPETLMHRPSAQAGPISFRAPFRVGPGNATVRMAFSYFDLVPQGSSFESAIYLNQSPDPSVPDSYSKGGGIDAQAKVGLLNVGGTYGASSDLDLYVNVPIVIATVRARQVFAVTRETADEETPTLARTSSIDELDAGLASGEFVYVKRDFNVRQGDFFDDGTTAGLGRITLGAKYALSLGDWWEVGLWGEFYAPSPSEGQYAGSASASLLPRVVVIAELGERVAIHADLGYEHDFTDSELSRFTWNVGGSYSFGHVTLDAGVGGSKFNHGIIYADDLLITMRQPVGGDPFAETSTRVTGPHRLTDLYVDFLAGAKWRVTDSVAIGGTFTLPINDAGFRADVTGTLAVEVLF